MAAGPARRLIPARNGVRVRGAENHRSRTLAFVLKTAERKILRLDYSDPALFAYAPEDKF